LTELLRPVCSLLASVTQLAKTSSMPTPRSPHDRSRQQASARPATPQPVTLLQSRGGPDLYVADKIGTLCVAGWTCRTATAQAGGRIWQITRRGIWPVSIQATDAAGDVIGEFSGGRLDQSMTLRWSNRELVLWSNGPSDHRYVLIDGDRALTTIDGDHLSKRSPTISITDAGDTDPGLLLFAVYVVHAVTQRCRARGRSRGQVQYTHVIREVQNAR
jgi:hypothetical protein